MERILTHYPRSCWPDRPGWSMSVRDRYCAGGPCKVVASGVAWRAVEDKGVVNDVQVAPVGAPEQLDHPSFGDQFPLRLDAKGRVILPPVFRPAFGAGGRLRPYGTDCLGLWTEHGFKLFDKRMYAKREVSLSGNGPRRSLYASAATVMPDSQGRFVIPERLRTVVGLTLDVTVVGNIDHIEIWPSHAWDAASQDGEEMLAMEIATDNGPHPDQLR